MANESEAVKDTSSGPPVTLLIFTSHNPTLTFDQFRDHYENNHVQLIEECLGQYTPIGFVRYYTDRSGRDTSQASLFGVAPDSEHDCCAVATWQDQNALNEALKLFVGPGAKAIAEDEARFLDTTKTKRVAIGEAQGRLAPIL